MTSTHHLKLGQALVKITAEIRAEHCGKMGLEITALSALARGVEAMQEEGGWHDFLIPQRHKGNCFFSPQRHKDTEIKNLRAFVPLW